jgi:hypothetical protein
LETGWKKENYVLNSVPGEKLKSGNESTNRWEIETDSKELLEKGGRELHLPTE